ncbi:MAG: chorismate synthase [Planctomycetes bacterium]|nr:chorismate synthase [Planctomycetota bacterium]
MIGNTFGRCFRVTACGESYGKGLGIIIDGIPAGMKLTVDDIQPELDRRRPGQSAIDSPRGEKDKVEIFAGIGQDGNLTTGAPLGLIIYNNDTQPIHVQQYRDYRYQMRPGHAEFTYYVKYGEYADWCGAGRASGRETACRVAAGAVAKKILARENIEVIGYVKQLMEIKCPEMSFEEIKKGLAEHPNHINCPDPEVAQKMIARCMEIKEKGDTAGGIIEFIARNVPAGLGEPAFDKLSATISHGIMSIPAVKAIEFGAGFGFATMTGFESNDQMYYDDNGDVKFKTNHGGGLLGGISCGDDIVGRVCVKATSTIDIKQDTIDVKEHKNTVLSPITRRDPTICGRAVPVIEAMVAMSIVDHLMLARGFEAVQRLDKEYTI